MHLLHAVTTVFCEAFTGSCQVSTALMHSQLQHGFDSQPSHFAQAVCLHNRLLGTCVDSGISWYPSDTQSSLVSHVHVLLLQTLLSHVVTSHVRSAVHGIPAGASMIRAMANIYSLYMQRDGTDQLHSSLST